jgi:hypothetical protein
LFAAECRYFAHELIQERVPNGQECAATRAELEAASTMSEQHIATLVLVSGCHGKQVKWTICCWKLSFDV